jgi:hypothetical protein
MEREQGVAWFNGEPELDKSVEAVIKPGSWIGTPKGEPNFQNVSFLVNKGRVFIDLAASELSPAYARHLLGDRFNVIALSGVGKGSPKQDLHFYQLVMPFVAPIPGVMNIFVLLTDFDEVYATLSHAEKSLFDLTADGGWGARIAPRHAHDRRSNTNAAFPYVSELRRDGKARAVRFDKIDKG